MDAFIYCWSRQASETKKGDDGDGEGPGSFGGYVAKKPVCIYGREEESKDI